MNVYNENLSKYFLIKAKMSYWNYTETGACVPRPSAPKILQEQIYSI